MSTKEQIITLIESMPENLLSYALACLKGLSDMAEAEDDAFCEQLYKDYLNDPDRGEFISIEDAAKELGVDL